MRPLIGLVLLLFISVPAAAQETGVPRDHAATVQATAPRPGEPRTSLGTAGAREGARLARDFRARPQETGAQSRKTKTWISRHPALFGALIGAGAGAVASGTMENELFCSGGDEDCFFHGGSRLLVGAGMGAGIGALVGWLGSR
jgi:hypothetical protein